MNRITIIGNIGKDAEVRTVGNKAVINFNVAVTEKWGSGDDQSEKTSWYQCAYWRPQDKTAISQYLKSGAKVFVEGRPEAEAYEGKSGTVAVIKINVGYIDIVAYAKNDAEKSTARSERKTMSGNELDKAVSQSRNDDNDLPF